MTQSKGDAFGPSPRERSPDGSPPSASVSIAGLVGSDAVLGELKRRCWQSSQAHVASTLGLSAAYANDILHHRREISDRVAELLGFERLVLFRPIAQRIGAGTDETPQAVQPEGREPDPEGDAPKDSRHD